MKEDRDKLKEYFETGDRPSEAQFIKFIDSMIIQKDDDVWVTGPDKKVGIGKEFPDEKLHVDGHIKLEGDVTGSKTWRTFSIHSAPNLHGPYMHLHPKDVQNRGGEITFVAAEGNRGGFRFLQYEKDGGGNQHWHPRMAIHRDGNVGIGTEAPVEKLHVDGSIRLHGDISGQHSWRTWTIGAAPNLAGPYMHFHPKDVQNSGGEMTFVAGEGARGGFRFLQYEKDGGGNQHWRPRVNIKQDGKVGIGTESPGNKLEIDNSGGGDTGLMLPEGAGQGKVLISDSAGNASWQPPSYLDDGDWVIHSNGNDIYSGKPGKVGIGNNNPEEQLHVSGNLQISNGRIKGDVPNGQFFVGNHGPYLQLDGNGIGGTFKMIAGDGASGGFTFYQKVNNGGQFSYPKLLRIKSDGTLVTMENNINFRGSTNTDHGIGWFGSGKAFSGENVDGPVMFGYDGGALGSNRSGNQKIAVRWDVNGKMDFRNDVNVNGSIKIRGKSPFFAKRYSVAALMDSGWDTGKLASEFAAASISGFKTNSSYILGSNKWKIRAFMYLSGGTWHINADWESVDVAGPSYHERWSIDVLFIRHGIVELDPGDNWASGL